MEETEMRGLRVVLAAIVVLDLCNRIPDLRAHYTDEGYFPRKLMLSSWQMPGYFRYALVARAANECQHPLYERLRVLSADSLPR